MTSDLGTLLRRAQRARRSARFLSSLTVIVGIVIRRYYHVRLWCLLKIDLRAVKPASSPRLRTELGTRRDTDRTATSL
jgi:hypothetical protein